MGDAGVDVGGLDEAAVGRVAVDPGQGKGLRWCGGGRPHGALGQLGHREDAHGSIGVERWKQMGGLVRCAIADRVV